MVEALKSHVAVQLNSRQRSKGIIEEGIFRLSHQIKFSQSPTKSYYMRLEDITIPKTFYDIDATNNTFIVLEEDGTATATYDTLTVTVPPGNYTITELLTQIESDLDTNTNNGNAYTLSYDDITNKITIEFDDNGGGSPSLDVIIDTIANGSTINDPLGVGKTSPTLLDVPITLLNNTPQEMTYTVDLDTKSYIAIETDITSSNFYDLGSQSYIGATVPVNVGRNEKVYHEAHDGFLNLINSKGPIATVGYRLHDEFENTINLNGAEWSCILAIYEKTDFSKR